MTSIQATKLVGYPWSDLFNLVLDVKSYREFVPHCREVRLLSRKMEAGHDHHRVANDRRILGV
jgi:ribosome-associated toxin RatA of RatAB toxin-antitoxin module